MRDKIPEAKTYGNSRKEHHEQNPFKLREKEGQR